MNDITPEHCFTKCAEALELGKVDVALEWRQLGEAVAATNARKR